MPEPRDPMDDFQLIEPGPESADDRGTDRPIPPSPVAANAPAIRRPTRQQPSLDFDPEPSRKWLLPVGIGAAVVLVGGIVAAVMLTGTDTVRSSMAIVANPEATVTNPRTTVTNERVRPTVASSGWASRGPSSGRSPTTGVEKSGPASAPKSVVEPPTSQNPPAFRAVSTIALPKYSGRVLETFNSEFGYHNACIGGHGRYLFLCGANSPEIEVIDLTTGRRNPDLRFTKRDNPVLKLVAGPDVLVAVSLNGGEAVSWDLKDFSQVADTKLETSWESSLVLMGSGTNGPLLVTSGKASSPVAILDPCTLQKVKYRFDNDTARDQLSAATYGTINATGTLLATHRKTTSTAVPTQFWKIGSDSIHLIDTKVQSTSDDRAILHPDGDTIIDPKGEHRLSDGRKSEGVVRESTQGRSYSLDVADPSVGIWSYGSPVVDLILRKSGEKEQYARLTHDSEAMAIVYQNVRANAPERCALLLYNARSEIAVIVGFSRVSIWHAIAANQKSAKILPPPPKSLPPMSAPKVAPTSDNSAPKIAAKQGRSIGLTGTRAYAYQVRVVPMPTFPLMYELERGPEGMKIDDAGLVTWEPVAGPTSVSHEIVVRVYNEAEKFELKDSWKLTVFGKAKN